MRTSNEIKGQNIYIEGDRIYFYVGKASKKLKNMIRVLVFIIMIILIAMIGKQTNTEQSTIALIELVASSAYCLVSLILEVKRIGRATVDINKETTLISVKNKEYEINTLKAKYYYDIFKKQLKIVSNNATEIKTNTLKNKLVIQMECSRNIITKLSIMGVKVKMQ